jgi:release factor glutamine methyltransferase
MRRAIRPGASVLDIGTGPAGVLAIYAKNRLRGGLVVGVDHARGLLATAAATADRCGARVEFAAASLGSALSGRFDLIVFNAPYISLDDGRRLGLLPDRVAEQRWSGGPTGLETIRSFLEDAPGHLATSGCILLGVNYFYVSSSAVARLIAEAGLAAVSIVRHRLTRAAAYVLQPSAQNRRSSNTLPDTSTTSPSKGA